MNSPSPLIACHDCGLMVPMLKLRTMEAARCPRCGSMIYRHKPHSIDRALALQFTGLMLLLLANFYPIMSLRIAGEHRSTTIIFGAVELFKDDMWVLSALVFLTCIVFPLMYLLTHIYVLSALRFRRGGVRLGGAYRLCHYLDEWVMLDVYMLGIMVALTKLSDIADVEIGIGLYAFIAFLLTSMAAKIVEDPMVVWADIERRARLCR